MSGSPRRVIVLSDLHLGPDGPLSTFRDSEALANYLKRIARPEEPPTELVLAGDIFDFLQVQGYDGFSSPLAVERFSTILKGSRTQQVIQALRTFAADPRHAITLLAGNHDPEMLLPEVRAHFEKAIGREGSVLYPDDTPLVPRTGETWPVWGHSVGNADGFVWIIHGDRWDPLNSIDRDAIRHAARWKEHVALPHGSRLVYEVISHLQPHHSWVVELKPELPAVVPLLLYLDRERTWGHLRKNLGLGTSLLRSYIQGELRRAPLFTGSPPVATGSSAQPPMEQALAALLAQGIRQANPSDPELLTAQLMRWLETEPATGQGMLSGGGPIVRALLGAWLTRLRETDRFQALDGPDSIHALAFQRLPEGLVALVAGHTHGPRLRSDLSPPYYNTGTWIPVGSIPNGDVEAVAQSLASGTWGAEAPRTLVRIELGEGPPTVHLESCNSKGEPQEVFHDAQG